MIPYGYRAPQFVGWDGTYLLKSHVNISSKVNLIQLPCRYRLEPFFYPIIWLMSLQELLFPGLSIALGQCVLTWISTCTGIGVVEWQHCLRLKLRLRVAKLSLPPLLLVSLVLRELLRDEVLWRSVRDTCSHLKGCTLQSVSSLDFKIVWVSYKDEKRLTTPLFPNQRDWSQTWRGWKLEIKYFCYSLKWWPSPQSLYILILILMEYARWFRECVAPIVGWVRCLWAAWVHQRSPLP